MKKRIPNSIVWILLLILLAAVVYLFVMLSHKPSKYDGFAKCIAEKQVTFYGAFWCPHCQEQKAMFGKSVKYLAYNECSAPDGQSQLKVCDDAKVERYPTWVFADQSRVDRVMSLDELAAKTGCVLPAK